MDNQEQQQKQQDDLLELIFPHNNNNLMDDLIENKTQLFNCFTSERILKHLPQCHKNHTISPIHIYSSFAILFLGQTNKIDSELHRHLFLTNQVGEDLPIIFTALRDILLSFTFEGMKLRPNYEIKHIFRLLIEERALSSKTFKNSVKQYFDIEIDKINFLRDGHFIGQQITDLNRLELNYQNIHSFRTRIDRNTQLVILTSVRFKSQWEVSFGIKDDYFYTENERTTVQMMSIYNQKWGYYYSSIWDSDLVEIPFARNCLSFILIVPKTVNGLKKLLDAMDFKSLKNAINNVCPHSCDVFLPKFKVECDYDFARLTPHLKVFNNKGQLFNIGGGLPIKANNILHKVLFEIDEKGLKPPNNAWDKRTHKVVRADHPFFFVVKDNRTLAWVIVGQIYSP